MKAIALSILGLGASAATAPCQSNSSSANYALLSAPPGGGGGAANNGAGIQAHTSVGAHFAGTVTAVTPSGVRDKPNYIGQLYNVTGMSLHATPLTVDEGGTRQLAATAALDDLTMLILPGSEVNWSVTLGPLSGIDAAGLATAAPVYQDTPAIAQGTFQGIAGQLALTVVNTDPDNFETYGGDGLNDAWQVNFFGLPPNSDAGPNANPDQDLHINRIEFLTGYDPTDPGSFFSFEVIDLAGTTTTLVLSKIIPGTRYHLERSVDLEQSDPFTQFTNFTTLTELFNHQLTDPNATGARWFYRVGVEPE